MGKTVAVVSNNNSATDNVYEKLKNEKLDYLCARLGKKENKEKFIKEQTGEYITFASKIENVEKLEEKIGILNKSAIEIFNVQNKIAKLKESFREIEIEHKYFDKYSKEFEWLNKSAKEYLHKGLIKLTSNTIIKLKIEYEDIEKESLWFRFKCKFIYGVGNKKFYKQPKSNIIKCFDKIFFELKENEIKSEIMQQEKKLNYLNENKIETLTTESMKVFNEYLRKRYNKEVKRRIFSLEDLYSNSREFNEEYPIVFSTTYSIKNSLGYKHKYDYIIMDESSQVDLITGALALSVAKNAVIVGDLKQLQNVITTENRSTIEEITKKYNIEDNYNYLQNSFLKSVKDTIECEATLLREHYRCHPKIIEFCNKKFYNNQLIIMSKDNGEKDVLKAYITTKGNHARGHWNQRQIDVIKNEVIPELSEKVGKENIGIISPYRQQKNKIQQTFENALKTDTVHKFQGREEKAIIITTVDNEITEFVDDPQMLNVAVTRAQDYLRLVVSNNENNTNTNIGDLIRYIKYNNFETVESKIKSIYDLLYNVNREERLKYLRNKRKISIYDSENLTYNLVKAILNKNEYNSLDVATHIPLRDILADMDLLNEEELKYAENYKTHIDLGLYNKMDKKIILGIEVDGYRFHKEETEQKKRDWLKDKILKKYGIPLIRLNTTGSGEEEIITNKIREILSK